MSAYPVTRLGDVADVVAGDPAPQKPEAFSSDGPLFVRMRDVGRDHLNPALSLSMDRLDPEWLGKNRLRLFPKDSILIPKSGVSVNLNHRAMLATDAYVVSHLAVVIPDRSKVEPNYLFWWSVRYDPRKQVQVTSLPSLKLSTLKSAEIPLPPLAEQRRIANILNRAARIERLRARAIDHLHTFAPALFVKMFGDPADNPMGWSVVQLGEVAGQGQYGLNASATTHEHGIRFIRITDIDGNGNLIENQKISVDPKIANLNKYELVPGDVLIARSGATAGKSYMHYDIGERSVFAGYLIRFRTERDQLLPSYLFYFLHTNEYWRQIRMMKRVAAQPNVNAKELASISFPLPPINEQQQFASIVNQSTRATAVVSEASKAASALTASLMDRLLDGDPAPGRSGASGPA